MKKLLIIVGFVFSALFITLALKDTDYTDIRHAFKYVKLWPMFPMLLSLFCFHWLKALRWSVLLSPSYSITGIRLVPAMMAGAAGNNLLPAHFGELIRVYFAGEKFNIPKSTVLATLLVERLFDVLTVLILFSIALFLGDYSRTIHATASFLLVTCIVLSMGSIWLMLYTRKCAHIIENRLTLLPHSLRLKISAQLINLGVGLNALKTKNLYPVVITNSIAQWICMAGCFYCALLAFDIQASPIVSIIILGLVVAGLTLPTSPGFFGTIEYCFVLGLATVGVDASTALSVAIYYHLPAWISVTLCGLILLKINNVSLSDAKADS